MSLSDDIGLPGEPQPASTDGASSTAGAHDRRECSGPGESLVLLIWALIVVAAVVVVLHREEDRALNDPVQKGQRGEIGALDPLSLLSATGFGGAMKAIATAYPDGRILSIHIDPLNLVAGVRTGDYTVQNVSVDTALRLHRNSTGETTQKGLRLALIDPQAPKRLVRATNRKTGTKPEDVDDVALSLTPSDPGGGRWLLQLARGTRPDQRTYTSDLTGHHVKGDF